MFKEIIYFDQEEYFKNLKKEYIRSNLKIIIDKGNN